MDVKHVIQELSAKHVYKVKIDNKLNKIANVNRGIMIMMEQRKIVINAQIIV